MKPRRTFGIYWDDDERERLEDSMRDYVDEDDLLERERDLREGQEDIIDSYEDDDADDLRNINIG